MCFFTFRWVFIKDCLKEKSDVSFMASPSGNKCYHRAPLLSPWIWNVRYRFLRSWRSDLVQQLSVQLKHNAAADSLNQSFWWGGLDVERRRRMQEVHSGWKGQKWWLGRLIFMSECVAGGWRVWRTDQRVQRPPIHLNVWLAWLNNLDLLPVKMDFFSWFFFLHECQYTPRQNKAGSKKNTLNSLKWN